MQYELSLLNKSGPVGYVILGCSVIAVFIVVERLLTFRKLRFRDPKILAKLHKLAVQGAFAQAIAAAHDEVHPMVVVLAHTLARFKRFRRSTRNDLERTLSHAASREVRLLERYLPSLHLISHVAPLLGLLGTVTGMIKAFQVIESQGGTVNAALLAGGIWEAMLTTVFGLAVAIPATVAHNLLQGRILNLAAEIKEQAGLLFDALEDAGCLNNSASAPAQLADTSVRKRGTG